MHILAKRSAMNYNMQKGISLLEVIIGILFTAIVAMGITKSTIGAEKIAGKTTHNSEAMQIGLEILEQYASIDPQTLDDADDLPETEVTRNNRRYKRAINITINPDRSRSVAVRVKSVSPLINLDFTVEDTFALWGER
uniref:Putative metalloprotease n=1 Tax=wastewater metagenome TaxID=527639 RepID=A0A0A8KXI2_9ZZZZ